jgi:hypothetical protein
LRGPELDPILWAPVTFPAPEGPWVAFDDNAKITVAAGTVTTVINPFSKSHNTVQFLDNEKFIYLSTRKFALPRGRIVHFDVEMAAEVIGGDPLDFFNAYVTFSVDDIDHGLIFNVASNGHQLRALYEDLPGAGRAPFCYFIEHPNVAPPLAPSQYVRCRISFGPERQRVRYFAEDVLLFEILQLPRPARDIQIGMGIFTDIKLGPDGSRSNRGQGAIGKWRGFRVTTE